MRCANIIPSLSLINDSTTDATRMCNKQTGVDRSDREICWRRPEEQSNVTGMALLLLRRRAARPPAPAIRSSGGCRTFSCPRSNHSFTRRKGRRTKKKKNGGGGKFHVRMNAGEIDPPLACCLNHSECNEVCRGGDWREDAEMQR